MKKNILFYSAIEQSDFTKYMYPSLNYVSGGGVPSTNTWTYNETETAAHVNVDNTQAGYTSIDLGKLYAGDVITLNAEILNVSGVKGKLGIDRFDLDNNFIKVDSTIQSSNSGSYETIKLTHVIAYDGYYKANCGIWTSDIGIFKMRNFACKIETIKAVSTLTEENIDAYLSSKTYDEIGYKRYYKPLTITSASSVSKISIPFTSQLGANYPHYISLKGLSGVNSSAPYAFFVEVALSSYNTLKNINVLNQSTGLTVIDNGMNLEITLPSTHTSIIMDCVVISKRQDLVDILNSILIS